MLSRRVLLRNLLGAAAFGVVDFPMPGLLWAQGNQLTGMQRGEMGRLGASFKRSFNVPALSVAISRNGQFVFDQGFGLNENIQTGNAKDLGPVNISSLFRVASLSKPITCGHHLQSGRTRQGEPYRQSLRNIRNPGDEVREDSLQAIRHGHHRGQSSDPHLRRLAR